MKPPLKKKHQSTINLEADNRAFKWATAVSEAGIPFSKVEDVKFRNFHETVVGYIIPSETSLLKQYLDNCRKEKQDLEQTFQTKEFYINFKRKFGLQAILLSFCSLFLDWFY